MATKTNLNAKINEVKDEMPNINNLATSSSLTAVENKKHSVSNLVKKTDYNTTINDIEKKITDHDHDEYITTTSILIQIDEKACKILLFTMLVMRWSKKT